MARFLIDESLPRAVTRIRSASGHDASDARDVGLRGFPDAAVLERARSEDRVLMSGDLDFANTLRFPAGSHAGILVLRVPDDWNSDQRARRAAHAVSELGPDALRGRLAIVEPSRIRIYSAPGPAR